MNQDLALSLGTKIREIRKAKGISQEQLALLTGIDRSYLGRIERGEISVTVEKLYEIVKILETELKDLFR